MATKTEICNMAISHLGIGKEIANIDTDKADEAAACRRFYDVALDATLRDVNWPFATRFRVLSLVENLATSSPTTYEWNYSYRYPTDCIKVRRVKSGSRNPARQGRASYKILNDTTGRLIYADLENAEIEYTQRVEDPSLYPADFEMAFSFRIAAYIAPRLTKGDPFQLRSQAMDMYYQEISRAAASSFNEEQNDEEVTSEFQRSRT